MAAHTLHGLPQVVDQMVKLAKKGMTPSAIGVILRDQHGISQVRTACPALLSSRTRTSATVQLRLPWLLRDGCLGRTGTLSTLHADRIAYSKARVVQQLC